MRNAIDQPPILRIRVAVIIVGMVFLAIVSWSTIAGRIPSYLSPFSAAVVFPFFHVGSAFAVSLPAVLFLLWNLDLVAGSIRLPMRSIILLAAITIVCALWFVTGWARGLTHQGFSVLISWSAMNLGIASIMWIQVSRFRYKASWLKTLIFHWVLFAWPAWCGFPWLGEGI